MNQQYTIIEDVFNTDTHNDERQRAYESELQIKKQNVRREKDQLEDKLHKKFSSHQNTTPLYSQHQKRYSSTNENKSMCCNEFYEHYLQCDFCRSFCERNEKFYQFVIFVLVIIIAILLRQTTK